MNGPGAPIRRSTFLLRSVNSSSAVKRNDAPGGLDVGANEVWPRSARGVADFGLDFIGAQGELLLDLTLAGVEGRPQAIYEAQHVTTTLGLVEDGLGVAAVPSMAMPPADHPLLVSVPLIEPIVTRKVGLIRRRGRSLSPGAQQLYDLFSEVKRRRRAAERSA